MLVRFFLLLVCLSSLLPLHVHAQIDIGDPDPMHAACVKAANEWRDEQLAPLREERQLIEDQLEEQLHDEYQEALDTLTATVAACGDAFCVSNAIATYNAAIQDAYDFYRDAQDELQTWYDIHAAPIWEEWGNRLDACDLA